MEVYQVEDDVGNNVVLSTAQALIEHIQDLLLYCLPGETITIDIKEMDKSDFNALPEFEGIP